MTDKYVSSVQTPAMRWPPVWKLLVDEDAAPRAATAEVDMARLRNPVESH